MPLASADAPTSIKAGEVRVTIDPSLPPKTKIEVDLRGPLTEGGGPPSVQILIRDPNGPPLPPSSGWFWDNVYGTVIQAFFDRQVAALVQDVVTGAFIDVPGVRSSLEGNVLTVEIPNELFPADAAVAIGIISPDGMSCGEYLFERFDLPQVPPPESPTENDVEATSPMVAVDVSGPDAGQSSLDLSAFDGPVFLIAGDLDCDQQSEAYAVTEFGGWFDFNVSEPGVGEGRVFRTAPGGLPVVGDWNGDGCSAPGTVFDEESSVAVLYGRIGDPPVRSFFATADGVLPTDVSGRRVVAGDFNGNGSADIMAWDEVSADIATFPRIGDEVTTEKIRFALEDGRQIMVIGAEGGRRLVWAFPTGPRQLVRVIVSTTVTDLESGACTAPQPDRACGVGIVVTGWDRPQAATATAADVDGDGRRDLLVCPADDRGFVPNEPTSCTWVSDLDAKIRAALNR